MSIRTPATLALAVGAGAMLSFCSAPPDATATLVPSIELRSQLEIFMPTFTGFGSSFFASLRASWARLRQPRAATLRDLDTATLADIGIDASEIDSIEAESRGRSDVTRRRIAIGLSHV